MKPTLWKEKSTGYVIKYRGWKAAPAAPRRRDVSRCSNVAQQVRTRGTELRQVRIFEKNSNVEICRIIACKMH